MSVIAMIIQPLPRDGPLTSPPPSRLEVPSNQP
jgi:hypothetical protein